MNDRDALSLLGYRRPPFWRDALCAEPTYSEVDFHARGKAEQAAALQVCGRCLVREECLADALADPTLLGIRGGTDEAARKAIRRNRRKDMTDAPT